jgi:hypothetical protein
MYKCLVCQAEKESRTLGAFACSLMLSFSTQHINYKKYSGEFLSTANKILWDFLSKLLFLKETK